MWHLSLPSKGLKLNSNSKLKWRELRIPWHLSMIQLTYHMTSHISPSKILQKVFKKTCVEILEWKKKKSRAIKIMWHKNLLSIIIIIIIMWQKMCNLALNLLDCIFHQNSSFVSLISKFSSKLVHKKLRP